MTTRRHFGYNGRTVADLEFELKWLWELLALDSPAGDEGQIADWLEGWLAREVPDARCERLGDMILAVRGTQPAVAVFAHLDTTGWTQGYDKRLIRIGGPAGQIGDAIRPRGLQATGNTLARRKDGSWKIKRKTDAPPGTRWVYAAEPRQEDEKIDAPYLDNRAGVWAALHTLKRCPQIAVAFTTCEETSGWGAFLAARRLYETQSITQALIADLTWHTKHVRCGRGVAISLRDSFIPRQRFLNRVLTLAEASGLPFQREIESDGGSDGASIERSGVPLDWVFVGAPEKDAHTAHEQVHIADLQNMAAMLVHLVNGLTQQTNARS